MIRIPVEKIRSYQTLVKQANNRRYRTKAYKRYRQELMPYLKQLTKIPDNTPISLKLTLNAKGGYSRTMYVVKMLDTRNTVRKFETLEEAENYKQAHHYIDVELESVSYGVLPDIDNAYKPIVDLIEELGIISNDRYIVHTEVIKTFNNNVETIDIELKPLEVKYNGRVSFG